MSGIFNEQLTFKQENGPDVRLVVIGDEHYAQYETIDGFTVVYDVGKGLYCYAQTVNGRFVSTGIPMSVPPATRTSPPHNRIRRGTPAEVHAATRDTPATSGDIHRRRHI